MGDSDPRGLCPERVQCECFTPKKAAADPSGGLTDAFHHECRVVVDLSWIVNRFWDHVGLVVSIVLYGSNRELNHRFVRSSFVFYGGDLSFFCFFLWLTKRHKAGHDQNDDVYNN